MSWKSWSLLVVLFLSAPTLAHAPGSQASPGESASAAQSGAPAANSTSDIAGLQLVSGMGRRLKMACLLCVATFLASAGTSLAGAVVMALTLPEFSAACAAVCSVAFS